jgi:hypothetical protein
MNRHSEMSLPHSGLSVGSLLSASRLSQSEYNLGLKRATFFSSQAAHVLFYLRSPVFLITRGDIPAARKAMGRIYGEKKQPDERTALLIRTIRDEQANSKLTGGTYLECFKGTNRLRTGTVAFLYTTPNVGGAGFLAQNIYFLIIAGLEPIHAFDIGIGGFGLAILIIIASGAYLKKISRRATVVAGCVMNFFFMIVIGALYYAPGRGALWAIAILM